MKTLTIKNVKIGEGIPKIIIPLVSRTSMELIEEARFIKEMSPDVVEWRVDCFEHVDNITAVSKMLHTLRSIFDRELLLFTFRSHREGGNKVITEDFYVELNETVIQSHMIDLVDVELFSEEKNRAHILNKAKENNIFVIMSNHDFTKTPKKEEIIERLCHMQELGADIPKIAVMPNSINDVLTLIDATNTMAADYADRPIITMSMGGNGVASRVTGELFGSALTFAAGKKASAPGQIPVEELRAILNILHKHIQ